MALDVVFLVDGSDRSITNFKQHKERFPHAKKLVTTLTGIQAYKQATKVSNTSNFYLVDHEYVIDDAFAFDFIPDEFDKSYVHVWRYDDLITNPHDGFMLDYGGVFLFQKAALRTDATVLDEVGDGVKYVERIASRKLTLDVIMVVPGDDGWMRNYDVLKSIVPTAKIAYGNTRHAAYAFANTIAETENYYVIDCSHVPIDFAFEYRPHDYDAKYTHVWKSIDHNGDEAPSGIQLFNKSAYQQAEGAFDLVYSFGDNIKPMDDVASTLDPETATIVFLSYDEPNAEENWKRLVKRFPHAKRVHKVTGILNAHKECAAISSTGNFFVVDGDSEILDTFDFTLHTSDYDLTHYVHIWKCRNPSNGLEYGYGGVKLFHKTMFENFDEAIVDMSTLLGDGVKLIDEVASITHFNADDFHAFRGAFRECTKLSSGIIRNQNNEESKERLNTWCTVATGQFAEYVLLGANLGKQYGTKYADDVENLRLINNFAEIYKVFREAKMELKEKELLYTKYNKIDVKTITNLTSLLYADQGSFTLEEFRDVLSFNELLSKFWLIDELNKLDLDQELRMIIVEGAHGTLANFLFQMYRQPKAIERIVEFDSDGRFEKIADALNIDNVMDGWRFKAATENPYNINYEKTEGSIWDKTEKKFVSIDWNIVIAPHFERMYSVAEWAKKIPKGKLIVAQTNNYGYDKVADPEEFSKFEKDLDLSKILFKGILPCDVYDRYMVIGTK